MGPMTTHQTPAIDAGGPPVELLQETLNTLGEPAPPPTPTLTPTQAETIDAGGPPAELTISNDDIDDR